MKTDCRIIRDLLPLYADDVCSGESRALVDEHLAECPDCAGELARLRKSEIEEHLTTEREEVIRSQKRKFGRRSAAVGTTIAWILMIPVVICLFVSRTQPGGMGWFFVVLASIAVAASLIVVPLLAPDSKLFWTFCAFTASLVILLAVTSLYSGGNWFFVAATAVLFGLSVIFLPFVIRAKPLKPYVPEKKALPVIAVDLALFGLMMEAVRIQNAGIDFWRGVIIASILIALLVYLVFPALKKRGILK